MLMTVRERLVGAEVAAVRTLFGELCAAEFGIVGPSRPANVAAAHQARARGRHLAGDGADLFRLQGGSEYAAVQLRLARDRGAWC